MERKKGNKTENWNWQAYEKKHGNFLLDSSDSEFYEEES